jgi:hypothetical protein
LFVLLILVEFMTITKILQLRNGLKWQNLKCREILSLILAHYPWSSKSGPHMTIWSAERKHLKLFCNVYVSIPVDWLVFNANRMCPASMMSLWHVSKHDRRGSIQQTNTAEMENVNAKRKTHSDITIFKDYQQWENSIISNILESRWWTCT